MWHDIIVAVQVIAEVTLAGDDEADYDRKLDQLRREEELIVEENKEAAAMLQAEIPIIQPGQVHCSSLCRKTYTQHTSQFISLKDSLGQTGLPGATRGITIIVQGIFSPRMSSSFGLHVFKTDTGCSLDLCGRQNPRPFQISGLVQTVLCYALLQKHPSVEPCSSYMPVFTHRSNSRH